MDSRPALTPDEIAQERRIVGGVARKGCGGCLRGILGIVAVLLIGALLFLAVDDIAAPWAWDFPPGRGTLPGEWVGSFDLPAGQHGALYLSLSHDLNHDFESSRVSHYTGNLEGAGQSCIGGSQVQQYALSGGADSDAANILLGFERKQPYLVGYAFDVLKGAWRSDTLTLSGVFSHVVDSKGSTLSDEEPNERENTTITLHRGRPADFKALCAPMGG